MIHDQPVTPLPRHIGPNPLQEDAQAEARRGEELKMDGRPSEPGPEPAHLDLAALKNRKTFADYGHGAFVKVAEGTRIGFAYDAAVNQLSCIAPLLHRYLGNPW